MDQTYRRTVVNEFVAVMWYENETLVRVWQHTDNHVEIYPFFNKQKWPTPWTLSTDMAGFLKRLKNGSLRYLTEDEEKLFMLLKRWDS